MHQISSNMLMMLPFEAPTIFEGIHKSYFRMPRVVKDQRGKFENDDLFRQLSHESAVKYTGFKDRPMEERQSRFLQHCQEGHTEISVVQSGNQFTLMFNPPTIPNYATDSCDFKKEHGKVHLKSPFILNGVCVFWRGWIDIQRLEGFGCLEFDAEGAQMEENMLLHDRMPQLGDHKQQQQQACNNHLISNMNHFQPLGRLSHPSILDSSLHQHHQQHHNQQHHLSPPHHLPSSGNQTPQQQQQQPPMPALGMNPCIGPPPPPASGMHHMTPPHQQPPPVSMTDSALHYSNAISAVYQAFTAGQPHSQAAAAAALHGLNSSLAVSPLAASLAAVSNGQSNMGPQAPPGANVRFPMNSALNLCDVNSR